MMKKTFLLLVFAAVAACLPTSIALSLEEGCHTIQIYSPWNEYYGRIYKGYEHGMKPGQRFTVWRGEKRIGAFVVSDVSESISRGKFIPDSPDFYITESIAVSESEATPMVLKEEGKLPEKAAAEETVVDVETPSQNASATTPEKASVPPPADKIIHPAKGPDYYEFDLAAPEKETSELVARVPLDNGDIEAKTASDKDAPEVQLYAKSAMPTVVEPPQETQTNRYWTFHQHVTAGRSLYDLKQFDGAIDHFANALRLSPDNHEIQNLFIAAAIKLGIMGDDNKEPVTTFGGDAPAISPETIAKGRNNYGAFLLSNNKSEEALEQFTLALMNNPGEPVYYRNRALALYKLGDIEGALDSARSAVDLGDEQSQKLMRMLANKLPSKK